MHKVTLVMAQAVVVIVTIVLMVRVIYHYIPRDVSGGRNVITETASGGESRSTD